MDNAAIGASDDEEKEKGVTLTLRLIRSFAHRNLRHLVLRDVSLDLSTEQFLDLCREGVAKEAALPPPFKKFQYDCLKIEHQAHGSKTSDPCMSLDRDDELLLRPGVSLREAGVKHETEIALFRRDDYDEYRKDPQLKW